MHKYKSLFLRTFVAAACVAGVLAMAGCSSGKDKAQSFADVKPNDSLSARVQLADPDIVARFADLGVARVDGRADQNGMLKLRLTQGERFDGVEQDYTVPASNVSCKVVVNGVQQCGLAVADFSVYFVAKAGGGTELKAGSEANQDSTSADVAAKQITASMREVLAGMLADADKNDAEKANRNSWAQKPAPPAPAKPATVAVNAQGWISDPNAAAHNGWQTPSPAQSAANAASNGQAAPSTGAAH